MSDSLNHVTVSVIIPAYNYAHFLPQTLDSVLQQTYTDWECIIVDDGSTDNTRAIVSDYLTMDSRFRYIYQKNQGLPGARNTGIKAAYGRYLQFLDADDLLEPKKIEAHVDYLCRHSTVDIVYGEVRYFPTDRPEERLYSLEGENKPWMPKLSGRGKDILAKLLKKNIMPVNAPLLRKDICLDCGTFDETLRSHEDWDFWLRCALHNKTFEFLDCPLTWALVRSHEQSMSRALFTMCETILVIRKRIQPDLKDLELRRRNKTEERKIGFDLAIEHLRMGNLATGSALLIKYCWGGYPVCKLISYPQKFLLKRQGRKQ